MGYTIDATNVSPYAAAGAHRVAARAHTAPRLSRWAAHATAGRRPKTRARSEDCSRARGDRAARKGPHTGARWWARTAWVSTLITRTRRISQRMMAVRACSNAGIWMSFSISRRWRIGILRRSDGGRRLWCARGWAERARARMGTTVRRTRTRAGRRRRCTERR